MNKLFKKTIKWTGCGCLTVIVLLVCWIGYTFYQRSRNQKLMVKADSELIGTRLNIPRDSLADVRTIIYQPQQPDTALLPVVFNIHGGAFVAGDADMLDTQSQRLANDWNMVVVNINYKLAPEASIEYGTCEVADAVEYIKAHAEAYRVDTTSIVIMGYSAGGFHALASTIMLKQRGTDVAAQVLCYPYIKDALDLYSALTDDHKRLAPALFLLCKEDPLSQGSRPYEEILRKHGVLTKIIQYDKAKHGFLEENNPEYERMPEAASKSPEQEHYARDAERKIGEWLRETIKENSNKDIQ